jgi:hypothetical protein
LLAAWPGGGDDGPSLFGNCTIIRYRALLVWSSTIVTPAADLSRLQSGLAVPVMASSSAALVQHRL